MISKSAANTPPIPVRQLCAELTAHALRGIQNLLEKQKILQCDQYVQNMHSHKLKIALLKLENIIISSS